MAVTYTYTPRRCLLAIAILTANSVSFGFHPVQTRLVTTCQTRLGSASNDLVDRLLNLVQVPDRDEEAIRGAVLELSDSESTPSSSSLDQSVFESLVGNYNVSCTLPCKPSEKPVGGKWNNGLFSIQSSWQNVLQPTKVGSVAQVVNVIVLKAVLWRIFVILRGDAFALDKGQREQIALERNTPGGLSERTVRADFDPPRISLVSGAEKARKVLLSLSLGPPSSVVLDTPFCNELIRIGKGSRGSGFVFVRSSDPAADEWKSVLQVRPVRKGQLSAFFLSIAAASFAMSRRFSGFVQWVSLPIAVMTSLCALGTALSTGGIVRDRQNQNSAALLEGS